MEPVDIRGEQAETGLQQQQREHGDDREPPERVVTAIAVGHTARHCPNVGKYRRGGPDEPGEPRRLASDETPDDPRDDQHEERLAGRNVNVELPPFLPLMKQTTNRIASSQ